MNLKKRNVFAILVLFVLFLGVSVVHAEETNSKLIRVGFPIQHGISYIDEDGNYAGYMVDYLEQLSLYTNWEYEFVQVDGDVNTQISTLLNMLENGEIDMLGTMNYSEALGQVLLYPNYSYGTTYTALTVSEHSQKWMEEDFDHWDGMKVAVYAGQAARMEQLEQYALLNGFTFEMIEYETLEDALDAVLTGEADATLQVDISIMDGFRTIARFSPTPYYFALYRENTEMLKTLNTALYNMQQAYPHLQTELYNEYFHSYGQFAISQSDREYIKDLGTVNVIFCDGNAPFQYVKDGQIEGVAATFFDEFAKEIGLEYNSIVVESAEEGIQLLEEGKADMVACAATSSAYIAADGIQFSLPFFTSSSVVVSGPEKLDESGNDVAAFAANTELVLSQIENNQQERIRLDFYSLNYYLQKKALYDNLQVNWSSEKNVSYSIAVANHVSDRMLTLVNHYTNDLPGTHLQNMLYQYMAEDVEYTFPELLRIYRYVILGGVLLIVLLIYIYVLYQSSKKAKDEATTTQQRLQHLSVYDDLTGAYNCGHFRTLLAEECRQKIPLALVAFNLRNFKYINESYGFSTADRLLCEIKKCLETIIAPDEFFCRESADIFYLALHETDPEQLTTYVEDIRTQIQQTVIDLLGTCPTSIYCGAVLTETSPEPYSVTANINYMLAALAKAKKNKKQDICIYDDALHRSEQIRLYVESHMQSALEQEEFQMYLQPKINLLNGDLGGAEALVRWKPKDHAMIYPDQFIPLFEENGFCVQLDLYMVDQVCRQLRKWIDAGLPPIRISVNQTRLLFASEGYVERLLSITNKYHVSPQYITLEILESITLERIEKINDCIEQLRAVGFCISMDDFGSGYSSLNTLGKLKIDELKLDRLFLMDVAKDKAGVQRKVMASILSLARQLNIQTVAEGVETKENEQMLIELYCDYGQGYYYSKPIPVNDFEKDFLFPFVKKIRS